MEFRLLGQLEVVSEAGNLDLGGHKQRAVLAILLVHANRIVPVDRLVDLLWEGSPPPRAVGTLRAYISNLRRILEPDRGPGEPPRVLGGAPSGYVLSVRPEQIDANRFSSLVEAGRAAAADGDAAEARRRLGEALALWRGPALADFADEPFAWPEAARLETCRLDVTEEHIEASLACGQHAAVVPDLESLVRAHPLRERLRGQLMLALYRCGRQADALRTYDEGRRVLIDELGIDPSPAVQELQRAILIQDPSLAPPPITVSAPGPRPALVGRDAELDVLRTRLGQALAGRGAIALLAGEPGIGKTRLAEALADEARDAGAIVLWGAAHEGEGAPPFWPWVQVVRRLVESSATSELAAALGPDVATIAQLVPEVGELATGVAPVQPADPELARFRLYDALSRLLVRLAAVRPTVVVLDDLHWADLPSLQLLAFLAGRVGSARMLVVCTYRDGEVPLAPALARTLAELARQPAVARLTLGGLGESAVRDLAHATVPDPPPDDLIGVLHRWTEGNPFFLVELLRLYAETKSLDAVPATVRDVVRHHLSRLSDEGREALAVGATVGQEFDLDVLVEVAQHDEEQTLRLVEEAINLGVVAETPVLGVFRFSHAVTRDVVYSGLSALRRARLHAKVAEVLDRRFHAGRRELVSEIAHHYLLATPLGPVAKAIEYAEVAAEAALAGLAFEQAEHQLRTAISLLPKLPAGLDADRLELRLRMKLGSLLFTTRGYSDPGVLPELTRALDLCRHAGSRRELLAVLWATWAYSMGRPDLPAARKLADELLDEARRTGDRAQIAAGHAAAGMATLHDGDLIEALEHLRPDVLFEGLSESDAEELLLASDLNEVLLEKHPLVSARALYGVTLFLMGEKERAFDAIRGAYAFARLLDQPFSVALVQTVEASLLALGGDLEAAAMRAREGVEFSHEHGFRQWELVLTVVDGSVRAELGDADEGCEMAASAIDQLAASGNGMLLHLLLSFLAQAYRRAGRLPEALAAVERGIRCVEMTGERFLEADLHRLRGELLLEIDAGRDGEAVASLETALAVARRQRAGFLESRAEASLARLARVRD